MFTRHFCQMSLATVALCLLPSLAEVRADTVKWRSNVDAAKIEAIQANKLVLLHFWSPTCAPCKQLDSEVFSQPQIGQLLEQHFVPVKINADISPALSASFNIDRVPTDVVLSPQGNVVAKLSCPTTASGYSTQLLNLAQHYRQQITQGNIPAQAPIQSAYAGLKVGQYSNAALATAPRTSNQAPAVPQAQTGQASSTPGPEPKVTHNAYATAAANPQVTPQVVTATPGRYDTEISKPLLLSLKPLRLNRQRFREPPRKPPCLRNNVLQCHRRVLRLLPRQPHPTQN